MELKSVSSSKPLTKEETKLLLSFIEKSNVINNKKTNATTNKMKKAEWQLLANKFNAKTSHYRTPYQLRLKWENLKKNSRKRNTLIRMSNIKTGGGDTEYIPPDEVLDRVSALLGSTVDRVAGTFGSNPLEIKPSCGDELEVEPSSCGDSTDDCQMLAMEDGQDNSAITTPTPQRGKMFPPRVTGMKRKQRYDENRAARNKALAEYYNKKTKLVEANLETNALKNAQIKLENEKLKLENIRLQLEIHKLTNKD